MLQVVNTLRQLLQGFIRWMLETGLGNDLATV